jgi:hypothetical protein
VSREYDDAGGVVRQLAWFWAAALYWMQILEGGLISWMRES